jgi:hypothetical protein
MTTARLHPRQLIRNAVVAALLQKTAAEDRVIADRNSPWQSKKQLPAISVYTLQEDVEKFNASADQHLKRTIALAVQATVVDDEETVDDALDALALEIETAMHADETFGDAADESILRGVRLEFPQPTAFPVGVLLMVYSVTYYSDAPDTRDLVLDDFKTADIRTNLGGTQELADEAHDVLNNLDEA